MKKILLVTLRYPFPILGGDKDRFVGIANTLLKKNKVEIVCISNKYYKKEFDNNLFYRIKIFKTNFFYRILNSILFLLKGKPMQVGFYYSKILKNYILNKIDGYDAIILHGIRSAEYLPENFKGRKILEMTDLTSLNFNKIYKAMLFFNPLKYLYFIESFLIKNYENKVCKKFDKVILISKNDIYEAKNITFKNKITVIPSGTILNKKIYRFSIKNYKIIFLGNIKYYPNKIACYNFIKNIMPILSKKINNIEFHIIGKISFIDKFLFKLNNKIKIHGPVKKIKKILKNSICGINNVDIATGFQTKILNYMSYGLPTLSFKKKKLNEFKNNRDLIYFKNNNELIKMIFNIKNNKKFSEKLSKNCYLLVNNHYSWDKRLDKYQKIIMND
jgi:glycosyltransferase involved in cell wall biosynthesis